MNKGEKTKALIIKHAASLFAKNGTHWVSFQDIANLAGVAQPTIYKYFADKDELLLTCIQHAATSGRERIDENVDELGAADIQIKNYIHGNFTWIEKHRADALVFFSAYYFGPISEPISALLKTIIAQSLARLKVRITAGEREGSWRVKDPQKAARIIHDLMIGEMFRALHRFEAASATERTELVFSAAMKILKHDRD